ncbi:MAG: hypothetical protein GY792_17680 [Gammaproteobacteria bacterium]|nr:hypothetical protein [Gammaproteobacteria bacterium]
MPDPTPNNPHAFPSDFEQTKEAGKGMRLRDYFAGQALIGLIDDVNQPGPMAALAYEIADAMLIEREKQ